MSVPAAAARPRVLIAGQPRQFDVSWRLSGHGRRLIFLALAGLFVAVITRRSEFAGIAGPALLLLAPSRAERPASIWLETTSDTGQLIEGEATAIMARVTGEADCTTRVALRPAPWITAGAEQPGDAGWRKLPFRPERWGVRPVGVVEVVLRDRWRLFEGRIGVTVPQVACLPRPAALRSRVVLATLPTRLGEHAARVPGEGIEFAGVREFVPGDRQRRINWPATTRRGTLQLNMFAAERAQTVVVLADMSTEIGQPGRTSLDLVARAAAGAAASYLAGRDRVGLISYGNRVRWIPPGIGRRQAHAIMDMILTGPGGGERAEAVTRLPRPAMPPGALILVFSPLLNVRLIEALREIRERGNPIIVIDVLHAEPLVAGGRRRRVIADLAKRIWRMEQEAIRFSLRELGIPVVAWDGVSALDGPLAPYSRRALVTRA